MASKHETQGQQGQKRSYATPTLVKLGAMSELTRGSTVTSEIDMIGMVKVNPGGPM
ncbi:MAG: lasso RiPP family leader peptide-containing protein [Pseudomonadota bacterium]